MEGNATAPVNTGMDISCPCKPLIGLLTVAICLLTFPLHAQNTVSPRVSLHVKRKPVISILEMITRQTGTRFFYNTEQLKSLPHSSLDVDSATVEEALEILLSGRGLHAADISGVIAIRPGRSPTARQQLVELSGLVTDGSGTPLPGATIVETGTANGSGSGPDGRFRLRAAQGSTVSISYLGMQTQYLVVKDGPPLAVRMLPAYTLMNEIVVNGLSDLNRRYSAVAATYLNARDLDRTDQLTLDNMLQGQIPGLNVNINSTLPGAAPKMRLRGTTTLLNNREPIWVIDGIVTDPPIKLSALDINSLDNVNLLSSSIIGLNPKDIERIDVLKDAAATSLYGVNGGNGVIVITTRKGKTNMPLRISFSQMTDIQFRPSYRKLNMLSGADRVELSKTIIDSSYALLNPVFPDAFEKAYSAYRNGNMSETAFLKQEQYYKSLNTDWFDLLFNNGVSQSYTVSATGGGPSTAMYVSGNYAGQKGPAIFTKMQRYAGMLRIDQQITRTLRAGLKLSGARNEGKYPYHTDPYSYARNTPRNLPFEKDDRRLYYNTSLGGGLWSGISGYTPDTALIAPFNIITEMENSYRRTRVNTYSALAHIDWEGLRHFRFSGLYGLNSGQTREESYAGEPTYYMASKYRLDIAPQTTYNEALQPYIMAPYGGEYTENATRQQSYTARHSLQYGRLLGRHYLQLTAGNEVRQTKYRTDKMFLLGYFPDSGKTVRPPADNQYPGYNLFFKYNHVLPAETLNSTFRQLSWYGMLVYSFKSRYTLNLSFRQDGSNYFSAMNGSSMQQSWSAAAKWQLSDEPWLKVPGDGLLAVRLSYGSNNGLPSGVNARLTTSNPVQDNVTGEMQSVITNFANADLRWEKIHTLNIGLDYSFFKSRLYGTIEGYRKLSRDLLANVNVERENGITSYTLNKASVVNYGIEASIHYLLLNNSRWNWNAGINFAFTRTRTRSTNYASPGETGSYNQYLDGNVIKTGTDPNTLYAYRFLGLDGEGRPRFKGIYDRDYSTRPSMAEYFDNVFVPTGVRLPGVDGAFFTRLGHGNWTFSGTFLVKLGYKQRLNKLYPEYSGIPASYENMSAGINNRWQKPGDEKHTNIPMLDFDRSMLLRELYTGNPIQYDPSLLTVFDISNLPLYMFSTTLSNIYNNSDIRIVNAGHVRLATLSLQHTWKRGKRGMPFRALSAGAQLHNVLLLYNKQLKGQDPELPAGTMPRRPSLTLIVDVTF